MALTQVFTRRSASSSRPAQFILCENYEAAVFKRLHAERERMGRPRLSDGG